MWRSIGKAYKSLKEGLIWRVGDGKLSSIWDDRWNPSPLTYAIQAPCQLLDREAKVCSFIDADTNWWNIPLLNELFSSEEAILICNIPICPQRQHDCLVWLGAKNGNFTVKSAYHIASDKIEDSRGSNSNPNACSKLWKIVWNMKVPTVAKMFIWKACYNVFPTKLNLYKKGVTEDSLCPVCRLGEESVDHVLWNCEAARDVWGVCSTKMKKCPSMEVGFINIFMSLVEKLESEEMERAVIMARLIWLHRNYVVFRVEFSSPSSIMNSALSQMENFHKAEQGRKTTRCTRAKPEIAKWCKPKVGYLKINWDAAIDVEGSQMGFGFIVCDHCWENW